MASSLPDDECQWWACDSTNKNELDPELKEAHGVALQAHDEQQAENSVQQQKWFEAESTEPIILRNLLSDEQIDEILTSASVEGVWPRGVEASSSSAPSASSQYHHARRCATSYNRWHTIMHGPKITLLFTCTIMTTGSCACFQNSGKRIRGGMESLDPGCKVLYPSWTMILSGQIPNP